MNCASEKFLYVELLYHINMYSSVKIKHEVIYLVFITGHLLVCYCLPHFQQFHSLIAYISSQNEMRFVTQPTLLKI